MSSIFSSIFNTKSQVANLDSDSFQKQLAENEDSVLIDVRTVSENMQSRIPNSLLIDLMNPRFKQELEKLDKNKSYYLYCRSGNRSYYAAKEMMKMGFGRVYNLATGIIGWYGPTESF